MRIGDHGNHSFGSLHFWSIVERMWQPRSIFTHLSSPLQEEKNYDALIKTFQRIDRDLAEKRALYESGIRRNEEQRKQLEDLYGEADLDQSIEDLEEFHKALAPALEAAINEANTIGQDIKASKCCRGIPSQNLPCIFNHWVSEIAILSSFQWHKALHFKRGRRQKLLHCESLLSVIPILEFLILQPSWWCSATRSME